MYKYVLTFKKLVHTKVLPLVPSWTNSLIRLLRLSTLCPSVNAIYSLMKAVLICPSTRLLSMGTSRASCFQTMLAIARAKMVLALRCHGISPAAHGNWQKLYFDRNGSAGAHTTCRDEQYKGSGQSTTETDPDGRCLGVAGHRGASRGETWRD